MFVGFIAFTLSFTLVVKKIMFIFTFLNDPP